MVDNVDRAARTCAGRGDPCITDGHSGGGRPGIGCLEIDGVGRVPVTGGRCGHGFARISPLTETASNTFLGLGMTGDDVLIQRYRGLTGSEAMLTGPEAVYVVHRLAEFLQWPQMTALRT